MLMYWYNEIFAKLSISFIFGIWNYWLQKVGKMLNWHKWHCQTLWQIWRCHGLTTLLYNKCKTTSFWQNKYKTTSFHLREKRERISRTTSFCNNELKTTFKKNIFKNNATNKNTCTYLYKLSHRCDTENY